ncbi:hypothetical protein EGW08_012775, partial [Elysia chlorotica]
CLGNDRIQRINLWNRFLVIGLFSILTILLVTPVRNFVTSPVLPASWREVSTLRILGLFFVKEKFIPVGDGHFVSCEGLQSTMGTVDWSQIVAHLDSLPAYDVRYFDDVKTRLEKDVRTSSADKLHV